ncbi:hypothetical protein HND96_11220 [Proteus terrae subsp. cibarius]|uniref:hypothetical protein n=1 Tax=Proteus terrae TaxID=1574161 RepID=UPI00131F8FB5|nr:hypothetical protein [Proteus terrae]QHD95994.1 hypothetical protein GSM99_17070 [Proteus terrae subsp. cibarius]QJW51419.1 hypothetical protein HND96_11220 [Proteus terrae subsp. cibarius]
MSATKKENQEKSTEVLEKQETEKKTCFVIMPIADSAGYEHGHFMRVYRHLIKPACERAGFSPIRADDVSSSNMIVVDILKKIIESDIAICDLSSRNPNVLYELGLRQAFNKKTIIIKDKDTSSPFDVSGFRYTEYDQILRIDNVQNEIISISKALKDTFESKDDINSIVQLLKIKPADIGDVTNLNTNETFILNMLAKLDKKIDRIDRIDINNSVIDFDKELTASNKYNNLLDLLLNYPINQIIEFSSFIYSYRGEKLGRLKNVDLVKNLLSFETLSIPMNDIDIKNITFEIDIPF